VRAYSQLGILTENSDSRGCPDPTTCPPKYSAGDLAQQRNFYNPEFDANLTDFTRWMRSTPGLHLISPEDFKFRFAWWGFYDGLYDYLDSEWADHVRGLKTRFSDSDNPANESFKFNDENKRARAIYGHRNRINELYLDYTKGPLFVRVGRQAISWGESDTIAILDVQNPFDLTQGAPGFFEDTDEARIPLWTVRTTYKLIDAWGALSSLFGDVYLVPGPIDTTVPINPIEGGVSPFSPDVPDPQTSIAAQGAQARGLQTVVVDRMPANRWSNSRWGARLTGVLLRDYTVQGWFFRTFNQVPEPLLTDASGIGLLTHKKGTLIDDRGFRVPVCNIPSGSTVGTTPAGRPCGVGAPVVTILERKLESVIGLAASWFSEPLDGIVRTEAEYFIDELGFIPDRNLNPRVQVPASIRKAIGDTKNYANTVPTADYIRWVIAYDRFFFIPAINPTNSFTLSMAYNSSFNLSEKGGMDFRNANAKPGHPQTRDGVIPGVAACQGKAALTNPLCQTINPHDYEDAYQYEGFLTTALLTDYMHGRLEPRLVIITDISGIFAFNPSVTYRFTDNFLGTISYLSVEGDRKAGLGNFQAHDMLQLRITAQLN
jgi:hypothetical protein